MPHVFLCVRQNAFTQKSSENPTPSGVITPRSLVLDGHGGEFALCRASFFWGVPFGDFLVLMTQGLFLCRFLASLRFGVR